MPVTIHVGPTLVVRRTDLHAAHPALERELTRRLTFPNPEWTPGRRDVPQNIEMWEVVGPSKEWLRLPRGASAMVQRVFRLHQIVPTFDMRAVVSRSTGARDVADVDRGLRDYQIAAARAFIGNVQGVVEIPTGGGKTRTASAALVATSEAGIVFTHTEDLADQWIGALQSLTGARPRLIAGASSDWTPLRPGEIAVAMIPTIYAHLTRASGLLQSAGAVVFDECHHVPAESWKAICGAVPAKYRWGVSATKDDDGGGEFVDVLLGPTVYKVLTHELIRRGFLAAPSILPVATGWGPSLVHYYAKATCPTCGKTTRVTYRALMAGEAKCPKTRAGKRCDATFDVQKSELDRLNYGDAQSAVVADPAIQQLICDIAEVAVDAGRTVLVLAPRREAVAEITEKLRARGINAIGVTSSMGKAKRREAIAQVRTRTIPVMVATTLADEGLDIPALDLGINIMSGKKAGRAKQRTGRLLRLEGQDPILVEMVHAGEYATQWDRRMAAYRREYGKGALIATVPLSPGDAIRAIKQRSEPDLKRLAGF